MRHQYTPIFREVLTSRVWAAAPATRAVWLWFQLAADPEGFVPATISGVAIGAHVSESEAREAVAILEAADPDCEQTGEGQILVKVPRGWLVVDHEVNRERAKEEGRKARNRRYMQRRRAAAANDTASTNEGESPEVGSPKPIPKPKTISSEGDPPKPPVPAANGFTCLGCGQWRQPDRHHTCGEPDSVATNPAVLHRIPSDWQLADELVAEARMAGVRDPQAAFAKLKLGPIGGQRGVFPDQFVDYIRSQFGKWRTWEETDRAKQPVNPGVVDTPTAPKVKGMPPWVRESHLTFASVHELDLRAEAKAFVKAHHINPSNLRPVDAAEAFTHFLLSRRTEAA